MGLHACQALQCSLQCMSRVATPWRESAHPSTLPYTAQQQEAATEKKSLGQRSELLGVEARHTGEPHLQLGTSSDVHRRLAHPHADELLYAAGRSVKRCLPSADKAHYTSPKPESRCLHEHFGHHAIQAFSCKYFQDQSTEFERTS